MNEAIVLLLLLWAALLVPGALRSRSSSPYNTVGGFARAMDVLRAKPDQGRHLMVPSDAGRIVSHDLDRPGPGGGASPGMPRSRGEDPAVARRRAWFLRLVGATGASLIVAIIAGGWLWALFAAVVVVTVAYTVLLRRLKLQRDEARQMVHDLERRRADAAAERASPGAGGAVDDVAAGGVRLRRWDG